MKVLIIDDQHGPREALRETLEERDGWDVSDRGFDEGLDRTLLSFRPDAVVLDLVDGEPGGPTAGNDAFEQIWKTWFCPVVVYSAYPDEQQFAHPLVESVVKGTGTDLEVCRHLEAFATVASLIRSVHEDFDARIREALRDSAHGVRAQTRDDRAGGDEAALPRVVRRLVAARVDAGTAGEPLRAWERFVVPPLGEHLLTADLLKRCDADWTEEADFRLVVTPSCDLVPRGSGPPRAARVLVARCEPFTALGPLSLEGGRALSSNQRRRLSSALTEGMVGAQLPIPEFRGHVPLMVADFRQLELIKWERIAAKPGGDGEGAGGVEFERVASTDSPFREMVVWAYLRVTGRPGVPEIDVESWLDDISDQLASRG